MTTLPTITMGTSGLRGPRGLTGESCFEAPHWWTKHQIREEWFNFLCDFLAACVFINAYIPEGKSHNPRAKEEHTISMCHLNPEYVANQWKNLRLWLSTAAESPTLPSHSHLPSTYRQIKTLIALLVLKLVLIRLRCLKSAPSCTRHTSAWTYAQTYTHTHTRTNSVIAKFLPIEIVYSIPAKTAVTALDQHKCAHIQR